MSDTMCICGDPLCDVPYGYCHCRCNGLTGIPKKSIFARGVIKGVPRKYIHNHHAAIIPVPEDAVPFKIDGKPCRLIPLTKGQYAIVDAEDYLPLMKYKWQAQQVSLTSHTRIQHYAITTERGTGKRIYMHLLLAPSPEGKQTDHHNGLSLDNRKGNLHAGLTSSQQQIKSVSRANSSGYVGVSWFLQYKKFVAMVTHQGKRHFCGYHDLAAEAARARDAKAKELFGPYARLNFPNE